MRYYKAISEGYILCIGEGLDGEEITESEYNEIMEVIRNRPSAEGKGYRLKTDLTWEEYDVPIPDPEEEEITDEDLKEALLEFGVVTQENEE